MQNDHPPDDKKNMYQIISLIYVIEMVKRPILPASDILKPHFGAAFAGN